MVSYFNPYSNRIQDSNVLNQSPTPVQQPTAPQPPVENQGVSPSVKYFNPYTNQPQVTGDTGGMPLTPQTDIDELETKQLQNTVRKQRATLSHEGEVVPHKEEDPGFLSRVFDVLSRPNYAIANAVLQGQRRAGQSVEQGESGFGTAVDTLKGSTVAGAVLNKDRDEGNVVADLWHGLSGQRKSTFSDVLGEAGVDNPIVKGIGGFVLDVALDPTTYIGVGVVKAAGKGAVKAAGAQAAKEVLSSPVAQQAARETAENTIQRQLLEKLGPKGPKMADGPSLKTVDEQEKAVTKLTEKLLKDQAKEKMQLAEKAADKAGKVSLKFAGKTLGSSEKAYTGISRAFKPIRELEPVQQAATLFRPKSELGEMWDITRLHEGVSIGQFDDHLKLFKDTANKFNKTQRKEIAHAIEQGQKLDDPEMQDFAELTKRLFKQFYEDEVDAGLLEDGKFIENYVYHMYKVDPDKATAYKTATGRKGAPSFSKERQLPTLEEAKTAGMKPEEDIMAIVQERAAKHYREMTHLSIMEDAVTNFGIRGGTKEAEKVNKALKELGTELEEFTFTKPNKEVFSAFFPKEITRTLNAMRTIHGENKAAKQLVRHLDKSQRHMKYWMTVANPGHHVRNFVGNAYMAYQDGVRNPNRYMQAFRGVRANTGKIGEGPLWEAAARTKVKIGDGYSDANELMKLYKATGTKSGFFDIEVARGTSGKAAEIVRSVSNQREDIARLGHFIDALAKSKPKGWSKMSFNQKKLAAMDASKRVRKWQLDYGDLTDFEKNVARRIMMFYTFMRKNTPLQIEMLFTRPGKVLNVKKANTAIEQILGVEEPALEDEDLWERIPEWIQVMNAPQIGGDGNFVQKVLNTEDPVYGNMLLPTSDLNRVKGPTGIARDLLSEIRPELKIPIELSTDTQIFSGAPVPGGGQYVSQQLPITNIARKFMDDEHDIPMGQELFNYLTGLSTQTVTPQRQQGELRRQQEAVQKVLTALRTKDREELEQQTKTNRREPANSGVNYFNPYS